MPDYRTCNPFVGLDFNWLLATRTATSSDKPFLVWEPFDEPAKTLSFREFSELVGRVASGLEALGVRAGDKVLIHLENCPEFLIAWSACAELGAVAVTTNTRSSATELTYYVEHSGCVGAISQPSLAERLPVGRLKWCVLTGHQASAGESAQSANALPVEMHTFGELLTHTIASTRQRFPADPDRPIAVQYTSGTTSRPKGVVLTHGNALWAARVNAAHEDLRADDVHQVFLPLFHTNALSYSFLPSLWVGARMVLQPRFSATRFWDVATRNGCTWASLVPFCLRALSSIEQPKRHGFRRWAMGACDPVAAQAFGVRTIGWWGMTETISHPIVGFPDFPNTSGAIGRPAPEYEISILDGTGVPVQPGETGHLRVRGQAGLSLFKEYLNDPEATAAAFDENGFFITGDRVTLLENGAIQFADRDKDMLKVGGENVAASEIERVILLVEGVTETAVVGRPDRMRDEVPVAFVTVASDLRDDSARAELVSRITSFCRAQLADFKVPAEIRIVDDFPRATLEKIAKAELRKRLLASEPVEG